ATGQRRGHGWQMTASTSHASHKPATPGRWLWRIIATIVLLTPVIAVLLALETAPRVDAAGPPDATAAAHVRELAGRLRDFVEPAGAPPTQITASEAEINAGLAALARLRPGVAGRVAVADARVDAVLSAGGPLLPGGLWINLRASLIETPQGTAIETIRVGQLPLPPALVVPALRFAAER